MKQFIDSLLTTLRLWYTVYYMRVQDWFTIYTTENLRPKVPGVTARPMKIPSRDPRHLINIIEYRPEGVETKLPVHVSWQASGWILRRLGIDHYMHSLFAKRLNAIIIDGEYRKGPVDRYPSAQNDCEDTVAYVFANPNKYDLSRITIGGSSAGGGMALYTAEVFGREKIKGVFCLYPLTRTQSLSTMYETKKQLNSKTNSGVVLSPEVLDVMVRAYWNGVPEQLEEPRFSCYNGDVTRLPDHVLIATGNSDTLHEDGRLMIEKIKQQGSESQKQCSEFISVPDEAHEFNNFPATTSTFEWRDKVYDEIINRIRASWNS